MQYSVSISNPPECSYRGTHARSFSARNLAGLKKKLARDPGIDIKRDVIVVMDQRGNKCWTNHEYYHG